MLSNVKQVKTYLVIKKKKISNQKNRIIKISHSMFEIQFYQITYSLLVYSVEW